MATDRNGIVVILEAIKSHYSKSFVKELDSAIKLHMPDSFLGSKNGEKHEQ